MPNSLNKPLKGVLLVNLGTPDAATPKAVRRYLNQFLSDRRVVDLPRWLWIPLLRGIITPFRARKSAKNYQKIILPQGLPLRVYSEAIADALRQNLSNDYHVELAMCYGQPSIIQGLQKLRASKVTELIVLPLYPQYSSTTTAAVFDQVTRAFQTCPHLPHLRFIRDYYQHPTYIAALAASVETHVQAHGKPQLLLLSFHGLPISIAAKGDPYPQQCETTATALAAQLGWPADAWQLSYQSRFGKTAWLLPETLATLTHLPAQGITDVAVICPGFAADCLETLEEINLLNRQAFLTAGGKQFHYIPALNDNALLISALVQLVKSNISLT